MLLSVIGPLNLLVKMLHMSRLRASVCYSPELLWAVPCLTPVRAGRQLGPRWIQNTNLLSGRARTRLTGRWRALSSRYSLITEL